MAMSSARHAFYVAQEVETVKDLKEEAAEDKVLYMESLLARINSKVSGEAVTGHSLYDQSNIISQRIESLLNNSQKVNEN